MRQFELERRADAAINRARKAKLTIFRNSGDQRARFRVDEQSAAFARVGGDALCGIDRDGARNDPPIQQGCRDFRQPLILYRYCRYHAFAVGLFDHLEITGDFFSRKGKCLLQLDANHLAQFRSLHAGQTHPLRQHGRDRQRQDDIIIRTQGLRRIVQTRKRAHSPIAVFRGATDQIPSFRSGHKKELAH